MPVGKRAGCSRVSPRGGARRSAASHRLVGQPRAAESSPDRSRLPKVDAIGASRGPHHLVEPEQVQPQRLERLAIPFDRGPVAPVLLAQEDSDAAVRQDPAVRAVERSERVYSRGRPCEQIQSRQSPVKSSPSSPCGSRGAGTGQAPLRGGGCAIAIRHGHVWPCLRQHADQQQVGWARVGTGQRGALDRVTQGRPPQRARSLLPPMCAELSACRLRSDYVTSPSFT